MYKNKTAVRENPSRYFFVVPRIDYQVYKYEMRIFFSKKTR